MTPILANVSPAVKAFVFICAFVAAFAQAKENEQPNIIFILSDDHRYDFMGHTGKVSWLKTPNMDKLAREGVTFSNTFVSTALCSPSRASILTGLYAHKHTVVDNHAPTPADLTYFPEYMQDVGYQTAFFGKWHMGNEGDLPRPGFDHWEAFKGQGTYFEPKLNINGKRHSYPKETYIADLLTEHAIDWMKNRDKSRPFFLYLSHKSVHALFQPAKRHQNVYDNMEIPYPDSYGVTLTDAYKKQGIPEWVKQQRHSWHGVDYMYHGELEFESFFKRYTETVLALDDSIGSMVEYIDKIGLAENTLIIYMSDNGFSFGEKGLIDKRHAYEESMRVPLLMRWKGKIEANSKVNELVQNIDIAPTMLELASAPQQNYMHGKSLASLFPMKNQLIEKQTTQWRDKIFYEYYWEYDFPMTPTVFAVRGERYKYIRYQGVWDTNEFYDLENDPNEVHNLIKSAEHQEKIKAMANELYTWLEETDGMKIPIKRTVKYPYGDYKNANTY